MYDNISLEEFAENLVIDNNVEMLPHQKAILRAFDVGRPVGMSCGKSQFNKTATGMIMMASTSKINDMKSISPKKLLLVDEMPVIDPSLTSTDSYPLSTLRDLKAAGIKGGEAGERLKKASIYLSSGFKEAVDNLKKNVALLDDDFRRLQRHMPDGNHNIMVRGVQIGKTTATMHAVDYAIWRSMHPGNAFVVAKSVKRRGKTFRLYPGVK